MGCGGSMEGKPPDVLPAVPVVVFVHDPDGVIAKSAAVTNVADGEIIPIRKRKRGSVLGESYIPAQFEALEDNSISERGAKKNTEDADFLQSSLAKCFLFNQLDDKTMDEVISATIEKGFAKDTRIIEQGDTNADYFYVLKTGLVHVFKDEKLVLTIDPGGFFGELALMYNAPRAATCIAVKDSVAFALDRFTFRRKLVDQSFRKRNLYEAFLKNIPLLHSLDSMEINKIADAMRGASALEGEEVIRQGDPGEAFFVIEEGRASVRQRKGTRTVEINKLKRGDYFGEQALIDDEPRVATVVATTPLKYLMMDKAAFVRLLGPCEDLLRRNMQLYRKYEEVLRHGMVPHGLASGIVSGEAALGAKVHKRAESSGSGGQTSGRSVRTASTARSNRTARSGRPGSASDMSDITAAATAMTVGTSKAGGQRLSTHAESPLEEAEGRTSPMPSARAPSLERSPSKKLKDKTDAKLGRGRGRGGGPGGGRATRPRVEV